MGVNLPREPLGHEERTLADALARLPAVAPPPAPDARVLAQAREALESRPRTAPRRRPRPWWLSASLGTAAAAVLAAGVAWQAGIFDIDIGTGSSVPVPRSRAPMADTSDTREAVDVDLKHRAAPKPPSQDEAEIAAAVQPAAPPAPPPPPASAPADVRGSGAPAASSSRATPPLMQEQAPIPPAAPPPPARAEAARERSAMAQEGITSDAIRASGARLDPDTGAPLPHWREDARLEPDAWLERVRERLLRGDRPGAVQSLRQFQHKNPSRKVPDDLVRLLAG